MMNEWTDLKRQIEFKLNEGRNLCFLAFIFSSWKLNVENDAWYVVGMAHTDHLLHVGAWVGSKGMSEYGSKGSLSFLIVWPRESNLSFFNRWGMEALMKWFARSCWAKCKMIYTFVLVVDWYNNAGEGAPGWLFQLSTSWSQLRSWCQGHEFKPHTGLHMKPI